MHHISLGMDVTQQGAIDQLMVTIIWTGFNLQIGGPDPFIQLVYQVLILIFMFFVDRTRWDT